jgi:hypothetical protein
VEFRDRSRLSEALSGFQERKNNLLWRGGRDGPHAVDFRTRCDGNPNTLTVILDTDGTIFGGFTPLECGSTSLHNADPSFKSFLFTLTNLHNVRDLLHDTFALISSTYTPKSQISLSNSFRNSAIPAISEKM